MVDIDLTAMYAIAFHALPKEQQQTVLTAFRRVLGRDYLPRTDDTISVEPAVRLELSVVGDAPPDCREVVPAWRRLESTVKSVSGLFDVLYQLRTQQAEGRSPAEAANLLTDGQDLLRAAIVFTSAGIDASVAALLSHAVPVLAQHQEAARARFVRFVEGQVNLSRTPATFVSALSDSDPHAKMMDLYLVSLTSASFQGSGDLGDRASGSLGLTNQQMPRHLFRSLDAFFIARNEVVHRLDLMEPDQFDAVPPRRPRAQRDVQAMCDDALTLVRQMILMTAENLCGVRNDR